MLQPDNSFVYVHEAATESPCMQARISGEFVHQIMEKGRASNDRLVVLHPANAEIHSGQLMLVQVPADMGLPSAISLGGQKELLLDGAVCLHSSAAAAGTSEYVVCMVVIPEDGLSAAGQVMIEFSGGQSLITSCSFRLFG